MLRALSPIYAASKGTAEQSQFIDLLENARRQLESVYAQIPENSGEPPSYVQSQFQAAQDAWEKAVAAPKTLGFTAEKSFGQTAQFTLDSLVSGIKTAATSGEGIAKYLKIIVIGGVAIGALVAIVVIAGKK
jgi:hypothetical protein